MSAHALPALLSALQPYAVALLFVLLLLAEHYRPQQYYPNLWRHNLYNICIGLINLLVVGILGYYFQKSLQWANQQDWYSNSLWQQFPFGARLLCQCLLIDLYMYFWHRLNHRWALLWRFHAFHHADTQLNASSAFRFHPIELLISFAFRWALFPLLGIELAAVLVYGFVFFPIVLLHHSNIKLSPRVERCLAWCIVSPHIHQSHHSEKIEESNANYSSVLSLWDRLFGTLRLAKQETLLFGIGQNDAQK